MCSQTSLIVNMIPRSIFSTAGDAHSNVANSETLRLIESITSAIDNLQVEHCLVCLVVGKAKILKMFHYYI